MTSPAYKIEVHLAALKDAADRASGTMRMQAPAEANREAYRAFMADCFAAFEALAYELGCDGAYISDEYIDITGKNGCVDSVFLDLVDAENGKNKPVVYNANAAAKRPSAGNITHAMQGVGAGA